MSSLDLMRPQMTQFACALLPLSLHQKAALLSNTDRLNNMSRKLDDGRRLPLTLPSHSHGAAQRVRQWRSPWGQWRSWHDNGRLLGVLALGYVSPSSTAHMLIIMQTTALDNGLSKSSRILTRIIGRCVVSLCVVCPHPAAPCSTRPSRLESFSLPSRSSS